MEFPVNGKKQFKNNSYKFFVIFSIALLQSNYFNFLRLFQNIVFLTNFIQILLIRYEKVSPSMEFYVNGKKQFKKFSYKFFVITSFALLQSNYFNFLRSFQIIVFLLNFIQITLNRYEKVSPFMEFSLNCKKKSSKFFPTSLSL